MKAFPYPILCSQISAIFYIFSIIVVCLLSSQHSKFNETLLGLISICLYIYVPRKANNYPALRKIYSSNFERVLLRVDDFQFYVRMSQICFWLPCTTGAGLFAIIYLSTSEKDNLQFNLFFHFVGQTQNSQTSELNVAVKSGEMKKELFSI